MNEHEVILAPAERGPWGVVTKTGGPPNPPAVDPHLLMHANALLREGMIAIRKPESRDLDRGERCFRQALELLSGLLDDTDPKISYALDRLGVTCHMRGQYELAERYYLRSLDCLERGGWPASAWNEVTMLNLAILYGSQGRNAERSTMMERLRATPGWRSAP